MKNKSQQIKLNEHSGTSCGHAQFSNRVLQIRPAEQSNDSLRSFVPID